MAPVSALLRASVPTATVFKCPSSGATLDRPRQTRCPSRPLKGATEKNYVWRNCLRMTQCVLPLKALEPAQDEARPWHGPLACVESITRKSSVAGATPMLQTSLRKFIGLLKKKKIHVLKWRLHGDQAVKGRVVAGGQWAVHQPVREGGGLGERGSPSETRWREVSRSEGGAH